MDTVMPTEGLQPRIEDGTIYSSGNTILGADDKAGIASVLEAMRSITEHGIDHGDIQIIFSISEEAGLDGSKNFDLSMLKASCIYVYDMGRPVGSVTVAAPSHDNIIAKFHGKAAHAGSNPEDGVNAIVAAGKAIDRMKIGRIDFETTANIGVISGGVARNIVPEYCEVKGEARSRNDEKLDEQVEGMLEAFRTAAAEVGADVDITVWRSYKCFRLSEEDQVVKIALQAARKVGLPGELHETGGGSDANIFNEKGIPAVGIGVGYGKPHSVEEFMPIADLIKSSEMAVEIVRTAAGI
jgi:tripeptide aminopeptidase